MMHHHAHPGSQSPFSVPDLFVSTAKEKEAVQQLQERVKQLTQGCYPDVDALVNVIESQGIPVILQNTVFQVKMTLLLGCGDLGFIPPSFPKYDELVTFIHKHFPETVDRDFSSGVILCLKESYHYMMLIYVFYHAMACKYGLEGYQDKARKLYNLYSKKYRGQMAPQLVEKLNFEDTMQLRWAIRREREALQFLRHVLHSVMIPVNNGKLLEDGKAQA